MYGDWVARVQGCNDTGCGPHLAQRFTVEPDPEATPTPEPTPEPVPAQPAELRVATEPGSLAISLDWDDVDGAGRYWVRWRSVDTGEKLNDGIEVETSETIITVADYGDWVARVQGCNDAGCGPAVSQAVELLLLELPQNYAVNVVPGTLDLLATWDAVEEATSYKLRWRQSGGEFEAANAITVSETEGLHHRAGLRRVGGAAATLQRRRLRQGG